MINPKDYSSGMKVVSAEQLNLEAAGDVAVVLIESVDPNVKFDRNGEEQKRVALQLKNFEDPYILNQTSLKRLVEGLGGDERKWIGQRIPLIATDQTNPQTGESVLSVWVCDPKTWDRHLSVKKGAKRR